MPEKQPQILIFNAAGELWQLRDLSVQLRNLQKLMKTKSNYVAKTDKTEPSNTILDTMSSRQSLEVMHLAS